MLAKHEMFEEIGGGETSKQGQQVESVSCQANSVGQFRQALMDTVESCLFNVLVPPSFEKRKKKRKLIIFFVKALQLASLWKLSRQNRNIISIILTFSPVMYSFYDKILFLESPFPC